MKNYLKLSAFVFWAVFLGNVSSAQSVAINNDGSTPDASSILDIKSTTKGLLIPRMNKTERVAITTPATGLIVYQNGPDSTGIYFYNGASWKLVFSYYDAAGGDLTGSYPNPVIAPGVITTLKIADGAVTTPKIADSSITMEKLSSSLVFAGGPPSGPAGGDLSGAYPNPKIANGAVITQRLANLAVTSAKIADGAITTPKLANLSVTTLKLADNAVTTSKVVDGSITLAKLGPDVVFTGGPPSGPAGGELTGSYPNPTIATGVISTTKLADGSVTTVKLADNSVSTIKIIDGAVTAAKIAPGVIPTSLPPDGSAGGDLTGTYPNPTVTTGAITNSKLADNAVTTAKVLDSSITMAKLASDVIFAGGPPTGAAGGDLSGNYPNPTVATGVITTTKIADGAVTNPKLADNAVGTTKILDASVTAAKLAAGVLPTSLPPNGNAGGDLTGTYPNPTVTTGAITTSKLADNAVTTAKVLDSSITMAKLASDVVFAGGPPTGAAGGDLSGNYPNPTVATGVITTAKIADGAVTNSKLADNAVGTTKILDASVTAAKLAAGVIPTSLPPNGSAGGDLTGTYPNPTVTTGAITSVKLADNSISTAKIIDASVTAAKLAPGVIPTSLPPSGTAGGDLSGTYPNPAVNKIQGVTVTNTVPVNGQVLKFNGTQWAPAADNSGGLVLPYSATAANAGSLFALTNSGAGAGLEGINSTTNLNAYGVLGRISSTVPGTDATAVRGINNGMNAAGYGVWGSHNGTGNGVYGTSAAGAGVSGSSTSGPGVVGNSSDASAGYFDIPYTTNFADALFANHAGSGSGVTGISESGIGVWGISNSPFGAGVFATNGMGGEGVSGQTNSNTAAAIAGRNVGLAAGVQGIAGVNGIGLHGLANSGGATGGTALVAEIEGIGAGTLAVFKANGSNKARIDNTGKGFFNGGTQASGADVAEYFDVEGARNSYEPGDVLVISQNTDRKVERSATPYSTLVAGVYATKPGLLLTEENAVQDDLDHMVPMGVIGVIPTKVCLEGGAIKRGDLIVTSSLPGVAMKADPDKVKIGQVIGKALQDYNSNGTGLIKILVSIK